VKKSNTPELTYYNFDERPIDPTTWPRATLSKEEQLQLSELVTSMARLATEWRPEDAPTEQEFMVLTSQLYTLEAKPLVNCRHSSREQAAT
jgi:hypothetical protein